MFLRIIAPESRVGGRPYSPKVESYEFNIGYAVGLIVGEGSFTGDQTTPCLSVKLHEDDPDPLLFLRQLFGGRVYGPYRYGIRRCWLYLLRGSQLQLAIPVLYRYLPPSRKRRQFLDWAAEYVLFDGTETLLV